MKTLTRRTASALSGMALMGAASLAMAQPASAASTATVMSTSTQGQSGPSLSFALNRTFSKGKVLNLKCYDRGQSVSGYYSPWVSGGRSDIWYQTIGDGGVWVPDIDISTGSNNPVVPKCAANLPWTEGVAYQVSQAPGGSISHQNSYNRYAFDVRMASNTKLRAPETGVVAFSGWDSGGGGNVVMVRREGTSECIQMAHLTSRSVGVGTRVVRGQVVGYSGTTGNSSGPHLHLGVVNCSNWLSVRVLPTQERGQSYPLNAWLSSWNAK